MERRRYLVSGRVQGVGFRAFVERIARHERVAGWVRNMDDGRVELEGQGDLAALARFERALGVGPPGSRVEDVSSAARAVVEGAEGFHVTG